MDCTLLCTLPPLTGELEVFEDGAFRYHPPIEGTACQPLSFAYEARDPPGALSALAVANIQLCPNTLPTVTASASPLEVQVDQSVNFAGTATDAEDGTVALRWEFGDGITASEASPRHAYQHAGIYIVRLAGIDSLGEEGSAYVTVKVSYAPDPDAEDGRAAPVVFAGADRVAAPGTTMALHAVAPGATGATFRWRQVAGPAVELHGDATDTITFVALGERGDRITMQVAATLGALTSAPDNVTVRLDTFDAAPVPRASDVDALPGQRIILDASASYDLDGDALTYRWTQQDGPVLGMEGATSAVLVVTVPVE